MIEAVLTLFILILIIIVIIECTSVKNKKDKIENQDLFKEKLKLYRESYGKEYPKKIYKIGEWEKEVRKNLHSIVNTKNKYVTNKKVDVLIGDYNKESVTNSVSVLESMGLNVKIANSGLEIIDRLENGEKYDLIITNNIYDKGNFNGLNLLQELKRKENFTNPIIVLTVSQDSRDEFLEKGFDEYMSKLLDQEKVLETLPKVIKDLKFKKQ